MVFPFTGRSQLLGVAMAWRRRQAMVKWRWGLIKWRGAPTPGPPGPAPLYWSQAPLGHGLAPPPGHGNAQYLGTPSKWERHNITGWWGGLGYVLCQRRDSGLWIPTFP